MLFDTRGRRKHVVRVVYAILALLMGASLFLVVGPFSIGRPVRRRRHDQRQQGPRRTGRTDRSANWPRPERRSAAALPDPDPDHRRQLPDRSQSGNRRDPSSRPKAAQSSNRGIEAWNRYLKQTEEPEPLGGAARSPAPTSASPKRRRASNEADEQRRRSGGSPAHRRRSAADRQLAHHPGDLRVLRRQLRRRRQGDEESRSQGSGQVGSERNQQTDGRIPQARQGVPEAEGGSRQTGRGPAQGSPGKSPRRPQRRRRLPRRIANALPILLDPRAASSTG